MQFTKKLKTLLQCKKTYTILLFILIFYVLVLTKIIKYHSVYYDGKQIVEGIVTKYSLSDDKLSLEIKAKENILINYYYEEIKEVKDIQIGDKVLIKGEVKRPSKNSVPNTFNYQKYLYNNKIYKIMNASEIKVIDKSKNIFVLIKNYVYEKVLGNKYLSMFIIGDKSQVDDEIYDGFKNVGVAHLLAISGMHVAVLVGIFKKVLYRCKESSKNILIALFLLFYAYIVNFSASILRVVFVFILNVFNKLFNINLNGYQILFLTALIMLFINPFFIYQVGFIYSFITVFSIIYTQKYLKGKYIKDILIISFWAMLFTLPITISLNYEINLLTFFTNIVLIPFVTFLLYPLALISFVLPFLLPIFNLLTNIMELFITNANKISFLIINIPKLNWMIIILYYVILIFLVYYNSKKLFGLLFILIILVKITCYLDSNYYVYFFDVGQGDSGLIIPPHRKEVVLIDTGGLVSFDNKKSYNVSDNLIQYIKSLGISKLDFLLISHGDYDHMGEAINLLNNFKVEKVIFNCGEFNELEQELIKVLNKKKIKYYSCIKELNIDNNKLHFLNNKDYGNENDNSTVIYTELDNYNFLFMGDTGVEVEEDLIEKYNLQDIDFFKVGHHGSRTSSSKEFIDEINPKYSIISVGKNNRYGHPNESVLDNLKNSKIYRTDQDGSIMIKIKNHKLEIETCTP